MARLIVSDSSGALLADVETTGLVLGAALNHVQAETVLRCAMLMAFGALVEGERWPVVALRTFATFMSEMKEQICASQLM